MFHFHRTKTLLINKVLFRNQLYSTSNLDKALASKPGSSKKVKEISINDVGKNVQIQVSSIQNSIIMIINTISMNISRDGLKTFDE